jgi:hypothetical protein
MTRDEFIEVLKKKKYSYKIKGDNLVVTHKDNVDLYSLTSIPPDVVFKNVGYVWLESLTSLPPGVVFNNEGHIFLGSLSGDWFDTWKGNIEGIDSKRLLNKMIKQGVFER